ncbi:GNAT family N-acetyltransferase [Lysinibacter sp. HNR]|uniref:GNAT family N-acetyltransferase n=1 Tax=Lysinibacter sp. HNR TaxID=3031408 RepID=UPI002435D429|nr:GNAT family N-acetyltransferase [Lysinibacter sp. HNR]WGD36233.1 GNAT family N-acetyltransferase [Lysinibacter sp. HNR]
MATIRRGVSEDSAAVFQLARQFQTGRVAINIDEFQIAFENVLRHRDQETNVLYVVEDDDKKIVGYSLMSVSRLLHASGLTAFLQEIVVDEKARTRGLGSALVDANESYCIARGVRQLSMATARTGEFYHRLGYKVVGEYFRKVLPLG